MGAEEIDTEVPVSEVAPRPDPGRQYVGRAGGVLQVLDDGGGSRATTTEAGGGADDDRTGFGDADGDGASLAMEAELGAELVGSEFTADVASKDESMGMAMKMDGESMRRRAEKTVACLKALAPKANDSAAVAEFSAARSGGGFEATGPEEAEGDGDVRCAAAVTAAAPAEMAEAANFQGDADNVGASVGADRASGAVMAPEAGQTRADAGSFDQGKTCIVGGDRREKLDGGGLKTTGAEQIDTKVPISEAAQWGIPGRRYVRWVDGVPQVHVGNGGFRATTKEADGGVDGAHTGLGDADRDVARQRGVLAEAAEASDPIWSGDGAAFPGKIFKGGAPEGESSMRRSGRKADQERYDWNGGAEGALPDVDRLEPVVEMARGGMIRWVVEKMATRPMGWGVPTAGGDMGGSGGADGVADGVADGGMGTDGFQKEAYGLEGSDLAEG